MRLGRYLRYQYFKMLRLKDSPSRVAQGVGLGFAMDFAIPIPLLSIFAAFVTAKFFRMNGLAAVMSATALKPFFIFIVALNVYVQGILVKVFPFLVGISLPLTKGGNYIANIVNSLLSRGWAYILAGFINGILIFTSSYVVVYYILKLRKKRRLISRINE